MFSTYLYTSMSSMNNELYEVIKAYATKPHKELASLLLDKSKDQLIALFNGLITIYINDKNSSLLRKYITVSLAEYTPTNTKSGGNFTDYIPAIPAVRA